jgi:hypothetical protein
MTICRKGFVSTQAVAACLQLLRPVKLLAVE